MNTKSINRWSEYNFSNGKTAKNRVVVPPMASQTAGTDGVITRQTLEHYERLAKSNAGILFVEYSFIHPSGKGEKNQLGIDNDLKISGLKKLNKLIQKSGALSGIQIVHAGGKTSSVITGEDLISASSIPVPSKNFVYESPKEMTVLEIERMISWYLEAAYRADQSGFDILELHAAHGYGLNQWISPITNQRKDSYSGSIKNRSKILFEIVKRIKNKFPSLLLSVRLPGQDHFENGLRSSDMQFISHQLTKMGIDLINVSSGIGGWKRPRGIHGQGYLIDDAFKIKTQISAPVIGVGGIEKGEFIDQILEENKVDFAAVGRAILKNPTLWNICELNNLKISHKCCY